MSIREQMEKVNENPLCNYYGSPDNSIKPKYGVHYFVLDEYILRTMDQLTTRAKTDLEKMNKSFKKASEAEINAAKEAIKKVGEQIKDLEKLIKSIVTENDLRIPKKLEEKKK